MLKPDLVLQLRTMAARGSSACDMIITIADTYEGDRELQILTIAYFREAFGIGLKDLMPIGAWSFFPGGTWSREQVENHIMPLIANSREKWGHLMSE